MVEAMVAVVVIVSINLRTVKISHINSTSHVTNRTTTSTATISTNKQDFSQITTNSSNSNSMVLGHTTNTTATTRDTRQPQVTNKQAINNKHMAKQHSRVSNSLNTRITRAITLDINSHSSKQDSVVMGAPGIRRLQSLYLEKSAQLCC